MNKTEEIIFIANKALCKYYTKSVEDLNKMYNKLPKNKYKRLAAELCKNSFAVPVHGTSNLLVFNHETAASAARTIQTILVWAEEEKKRKRKKRNEKRIE